VPDVKIIRIYLEIHTGNSYTSRTCTLQIRKKFYSVSDLDPDWIRIQTGSGFNQISGSVSRSGFGILRRAHMTHKRRKKLRNFMF
jgi:hypothetical protein